MRNPVDDAAVEGDAVEQQEHAEADRHHGEFPIPGDEDSLVDAEQSQNGRGGRIEQDESHAGECKNPCLLVR